jgi:cytoskeletal protein RodZ
VELQLTGELEMPILHKKTDATAIPELQEYYASKGKDSTAKAWLLAFGSLLITVAVLVGLFFGVKWVYRAATNKDEAPKKTQTTASSTSTDAKKDAAGSNKTPSTGNEVVVNNDNGTATGLISGSAPTPQPAPGVSPAQTPQQNATAVAASTLPNTGTGNIVVLFAATTFIGALAYRRKLLR